MLNFFKIITKPVKKDEVAICPKFITIAEGDLMIRGGDFYAVWDEDKQLWSTDEKYVIRTIDKELDLYYKKRKEELLNTKVTISYMWDADSGQIDKWHKYCQKQLRDQFHTLDQKLIFSNMEAKKDDYISKKLSYPLEPGDCSAYNKLISTLYNPTERHKIEWAIGAIVTGDSKNIQKFLVFYGAMGTGKSTILNIIEKLFKGFCSVFDARSLGSNTNPFALEAFKDYPLVAIQHDGDLSHIEDNTKINSLVSHETMSVNVKYKSTYPGQFNCFLFMGTNKPVKITDAKSGLIRRLIDVSPSGNKLSFSEYKQAMSQIDFELGAIAYHCREVYLSNPNFYDDYKPINMMGATNDFYNFVLDYYFKYSQDNEVTLQVAYEQYLNFCDKTKVLYPYSRRAFKEELKNYFDDFKERGTTNSGERVRNYYRNFKTDVFDNDVKTSDDIDVSYAIELMDDIESAFDICNKDLKAQYANSDGKPMTSWDNVKTTLKDISTDKLHYVLFNDPHHIVIDFDIPDENGEKCLEKNLEAASKWPPTYTELSKSGKGVHLHYIYTGDPLKLSNIYDDFVEIKVYYGKSSLRRKLTKCNNLPITTISSGLPTKGEKMIKESTIENEKHLRALIKKNLNKEIHPGTASSVSFIKELLDQAYNSGMNYDVTDMSQSILIFAANSTHQSKECLKMFSEMRLKSQNITEDIPHDTDSPIVFFDIEIFPNLFLVCWKFKGKNSKIVKMFNPSADQISKLIKYKLIGYNNIEFDNHLLYACMLGYSVYQLYRLSKNIIGSKGNEKKKYQFREARNISYTDVFDFASAGNKKSLKKLEIEMGTHHQELGFDWDKPVDEKYWDKVADYCCNDVLATEAAFNYLESDWIARKILSSIAASTPNTKTNTLTTKFIFQGEKNPQSQFHYRNLAEPVMELDDETIAFLKESCPEMMAQRHGPAKSLLPYFPGYKYEYGKSTYRGEDPKEGGYVYAEPAIYYWIALLDIASMHPHSAIAEVIFGVKFTRRFREIVEGRVSIKHEAWSEVNNMLNGALTPFIQMVKDGEITSKDLANALKTAINSVYGLTSASFDNPFKDPRNVDNIVAKRGALFMINLKHEVQERGFTVAHIKTDSIKIPDATPEIIKFVMDYGKIYGYTFEHEATYERMCLVNNAVYIAKYADSAACKDVYGYIPDDNKKHGNEWTATGTQFQIPYVFKTLFSKEPIEIKDFCEVKSVKTAIYLDFNEGLSDVSAEEAQYKKLLKKYKQYEKEIADMPSETYYILDCQDKMDNLKTELDQLKDIIDKGHNYTFVGRVGEFCPVKDGYGGGIMLRKGDDKYDAVTGTKGFRWVESERVLQNGNIDIIDKSYHKNLADDAISSIKEYGDYDLFISDEPIKYKAKKENTDFISTTEDPEEELPFN